MGIDDNNNNNNKILQHYLTIIEYNVWLVGWLVDDRNSFVQFFFLVINIHFFLNRQILYNVFFQYFFLKSEKKFNLF